LAFCHLNHILAFLKPRIYYLIRVFIKVKVTLLRVTEDPEGLIAQSARVCYASEPKAEEADEKLIRNLRSWGHLSTFEHAQATFLIEGVSRACTHQLVRHRLASYSQQSQRYVNEEGFDYVTPPMVEKDPKLKKRYDAAVEDARKSYKELIDSGVPKEDARFLLPNSVAAKIVVTMNFRELRHFIQLRTAKGAQWEIRELAKEMLRLLKEEAPNAFDDL
jgi:thymidylate synthase (FAD)